MKNIEISFIIVSYNVKDFLRKCLLSFHQCSIKDNIEIIVVDNASMDGTIDMIETEFKNVVVLKNAHNVGFSRANNQGIKIARGKYIFLLNPDTEILMNTVENMLSFIQTQQNQNTIVAPQLLNSDGSLQISAWKMPSMLNIALESLFLHKIFQTQQYPQSFYSSIFEADVLSGAALLFPKENKDAYLDENLFWMEDVDLCYRNKQNGGKNIYFSDAKIIHHSGKSSRNNYRIPISNQLISKLKFFRKHKQMFNYISSCIFVFIHILSRLIGYTLIACISSEYRKKLDAYFYTLKVYIKYIIHPDKHFVV